MNENMHKRVERGVYFSLGAYIFLSVVKLAAGWKFSSDALVADGLNNATDIVASVAVLIGLKISRKPADEDHPYGHLRAETIASMVASFIMVVIGLQVLISSVKKITSGAGEEPSLLAAAVAVFSGLVMLAIFAVNIKTAKETESQGLKAAALDNRSDAFVSFGAAIGIAGSQIGLPWLDPAAAIFVGLIIIKTGWEIFSETSHNLSDGFDYEEGKTMEKKILSVQGVETVGDLKARKHGNRAIIDVTILVDPELNVIQSHEITERVEELLKEAYRVESIQVHVEPHDHTPKTE
ncbi:cation diffusion facilitator family transporter [Fictibacillus aquaticus]|uniref:Transporter n=1 Tax=Fictibacillus aquaticus TaxID=2021314 RepID=A0A235FCL8_9BACL|nr:cation diffusion facilitator family transporter [Fictibacillus aquaticus]OYD59021.1 transporter [Fictibacillus aquaticus]